LAGHAAIAGITGSDQDKTAAIRSLGWVLFVSQSQAEAYAPVASATLTGVWTAVGFALVAALMAFVVARTLVAPITDLAGVVRQMATGDLSVRARPRGRDETGELAEAFNSMAGEMAGLVGSLEQRVADRTRELARRARYQEASAQVARETTSVLDQQRLFQQVVSLISERFGFYHAGLFLLDQSREWAVLQAASSEGGRRMLARSHRLRVGAEGMVGHVTARGEPRVTLDVGEDAVFFNNPDLSETRSEMTLPLRARGEIIGALDVQSEEAAAFTDEDVEVLQTMADQVAVAISNARLFEEAQEAVYAERRARGELSREAWQQLLRAQGDLGFLSDRQRTVPTDRPDQVEVATALRTAQASIDEEDGTRLAIPVRVGGHVIGVVHGSKPKSAGRWTPDEIAMLDTLTDQLAQAAERARLYRETQRNAARERTVAEVGTRVRASLDLETMLRAAASEMRQALNLGDLVIRLAPPETGSGSDEGRT
jgi:GAF domain-containing protein/HAMP domain-containing protein